MTADDRTAVLAVHARYGDLVTRRDWASVSDLFEADATLRLDLRDRIVERTGPAEIVEFVSGGVSRFAFFVFSLLNAVVDVEGDAATSRTYIREYRVDATGVETTAFGLYRDRLRRTAAGWRFVERDYSTLARTAPDGIGLEVFDVPGA